MKKQPTFTIECAGRTFFSYRKEESDAWLDFDCVTPTVEGEATIRRYSEDDNPYTREIGYVPF